MTFTVEVDVPVPMSDGVALATNVWLPQGAGPFPALLLRTPYGKDDAGLYGNPKLPSVFALVEAGYAVVAQDVRGTSHSSGTFVPHLNEGPDTLDTLAWLTEQPWCDGSVGMWGGSYMGFSQWQAAPLGTSTLRAIAPVMSSADPYAAPWRSPGGALSQDAVLTWGTRFPAWVGDVLEHPDRDAFWDKISVTDAYDRITVPALQVGGWYDVFIGETVRSYTMMRRHGGSTAARDGQRLLIGPWSHADGTDLGTFPDRSFGPASSIKAAGVTDEHLRFFDRWVRGRTDVTADPHRVRIFVMGIDQWRDELDWPLPDTRHTDFFLTGDGRANSVAGDGSLAREAPSVDATDVFLYDPRRPVPSLGGTVLAGPPGAFPGPADQASVETRDDVLCFTTAVLQHPVEVTGHVTLVLHVSSSAPDTDFTGKLVDVRPDGTAILLCEGIQRARYRESLTVPTLLEPGQVYELTINLCVTANVFLPGHRIRLEVSSSCFPRYDRNPNTGRPDEDDLIVAVNRIHHGPAHPSRLVLPLIERSTRPKELV
jgi:uncharacterized protein